MRLILLLLDSEVFVHSTDDYFGFLILKYHIRGPSENYKEEVNRVGENGEWKEET